MKDDVRMNREIWMVVWMDSDMGLSYQRKRKRDHNK